jgi:phosphatidylinositol alpha-1,6-mannosyltransferase
LHIGLIAPDLTHRHGWASYSLNLATALRDAGARLTIVAARNSPPLDRLDVLPLLPTLVPGERGLLLHMLAAAGRTRAALASCDVIHATAEPYAPLAAWAAGARPLFITGHGGYVRLTQTRRPPVNLLYRWAFRRGVLVCVSRYTARVARELLPDARTVVVNNGVDASRFARVTRSQHPDAPPTILTVGALKSRKGTLELVRAMARVRQHLPTARLVVIGNTGFEPDYTARVQAEIAAHGLDGQIALLGQVDDETLLSWYGAADVFVLPSLNRGWKFEGYGLVLLEAGAAGLPVIGTMDCGAEDAVIDGVTGLLVPQDALDTALPDAIVRLLSDSALARRMGAAGRERAQAQTWTRVAAQMLELYTKPD